MHPKQQLQHTGTIVSKLTALLQALRCILKYSYSTGDGWGTQGHESQRRIDGVKKTHVS